MVKLMAGENSDLAQHIKMCEENEICGKRNQLTFLSNNFINKSLFIIRQCLVRTIVSEIEKCGGQFGLMMDATQDISFQEQISVAARYVDETNTVVERSISFFNAKHTSGLKLYELLLTKLTDIGLPACKIVGCSFDGAANMTSNIKGVISYIQKMTIQIVSFRGA